MEAPKNPDSYKQALSELDAILKELEGEAVDIDGLVEKVERGARLLRFCQTKLSTTEVKVKEVLAHLEAELSEPPSP